MQINFKNLRFVIFGSCLDVILPILSVVDGAGMSDSSKKWVRLIPNETNRENFTQNSESLIIKYTEIES